MQSSVELRPDPEEVGEHGTRLDGFRLQAGQEPLEAQSTQLVGQRRECGHAARIEIPLGGAPRRIPLRSGVPYQDDRAHRARVLRTTRARRSDGTQSTRAGSFFQVWKDIRVGY